MSKPSVGSMVEKEMERRIGEIMKIAPSRHDAIVFLFDMAPSWYFQTPEGEYLNWALNEEEKKK